MTHRTQESELLRHVKIAVCGELPTACEYLKKLGIIQIDQYTDAVNIGRKSDYHLILVYAPQGEGLFDTYCVSRGDETAGVPGTPIRLLNEPCCQSALLEIDMKIRRIARSLLPAGEETAMHG